MPIWWVQYFPPTQVTAFTVYKHCCTSIHRYDYPSNLFLLQDNKDELHRPAENRICRAGKNSFALNAVTAQYNITVGLHVM